MSLQTKGLEVGNVAPDWELRNVDGRQIRLADFRGGSLLLFFFRGTWCPSCRKQMEQVRAQWAQIEPLAQTVAIVGQDAEPVRDFLQRNPLPFELLPDPDRRVIEAHNVYQKFGLTGFRIAHPTTLVIDRTGIVRYCYVGGSQFDRPDLNIVIKELENLKPLRVWGN